MAVRIRLSRVGSKKNPHFRVVVQDAKMPRDGRFIEIIGCYNPRLEPSSIKIDKEKALMWLGRGAKPTGAVENLLKIAGILEEFEANKKKYLSS